MELAEPAAILPGNMGRSGAKNPNRGPMLPPLVRRLRPLLVRGPAGQALESVEIPWRLGRRVRLHGDAANRAMANRGWAGSVHKRLIGQAPGARFDPDQFRRRPARGRFVTRCRTDLGQCNRRQTIQIAEMWEPIASAPSDGDLELAVLDRDGHHALVFPCRRMADGWMNALTRERLDVHPTHWRAWRGKR